MPKKLTALRAAIFTLSGKKHQEGGYCPPTPVGTRVKFIFRRLPSHNHLVCLATPLLYFRKTRELPYLKYAAQSYDEPIHPTLEVVCSLASVGSLHAEFDWAQLSAFLCECLFTWRSSLLSRGMALLSRLFGGRRKTALKPPKGHDNVPEFK